MRIVTVAIVVVVVIVVVLIILTTVAILAFPRAILAMGCCRPVLAFPHAILAMGCCRPVLAFPRAILAMGCCSLASPYLLKDREEHSFPLAGRVRRDGCFGISPSPGQSAGMLRAIALTHVCTVFRDKVKRNSFAVLALLTNAVAGGGGGGGGIGGGGGGGAGA